VTIATSFPTDRQAIEQQIELLIGILDEIDGDPDLEPDHEDYDACDLGEPQTYDDEPPVYEIDQSLGPIGAPAWA